MAFIDIVKRFRKEIKIDFNKEVKTAESVQDEIKKFNERFPEWLEPLEVMARSGGRGSDSSSGELGSSNMQGDTNAHKIWSYFVTKGVTKEATAGIMGNIWQESKYDPKRIQNNGKGPGTGLFQWEAPHSGNNYGGRWKTLEAKAKSEGKDKWDLEFQLDYMWMEMNQSSNHVFWNVAFSKRGLPKPSSAEDAVKKLSKQSSIDEACYLFELAMERAGIKVMDKRIKEAKRVYNELKDWDLNMDNISGASGKFSHPFKVNYRVTSEFGMRIHPITGVRTGHSGIDLSSGPGLMNKLYAVGDGVVEHVQYSSSWGNYIVIYHGVNNNKDLYTLYAHMNKPSPLKKGDRVNNNTNIGIEGNTGASKGAHLHLEIISANKGSGWQGKEKRVNPRGFIKFP